MFNVPPNTEDTIPVLVCEVPIVTLDPTVKVVPSYVKLAELSKDVVPFQVATLLFAH